MLPWMRHIPSFLAPWKRTVEEWNREDNDAFHSYFDAVQKAVVCHNTLSKQLYLTSLQDDGTERASLCATLIHDSDRYRLSTHDNAWIAASI